MKKEFLLIIFCFIIITFLVVGINFKPKDAPIDTNTQQDYRTISDTVQKGETAIDIFRKHNLDPGILFEMKEACADIYKLGEVYPDHRYKIALGDMNRINSFDYWIDDDSILNITRTESGFSAEKIAVEYEKRIRHVGGVIRDNLISSIGEGRENLMLALNLSDIFAWDIDFTTDLRNDDKFKIVVEGLYLNGEFKKYGDILSAEFINNGVTYSAYKFEYNGKAHYYGEDGKSLRKAFLKAPLSFRRISSRFSNGRFHPVLKIYRPHHGLDYAAPAGTPVSAVSDGTINFSGYKGQYGKLVVIRHANGWKTYYGHLSRINRGVKKGLKVEQGQVIGYVGATGLATGPHLHYEIRIGNKAVNPLVVKLPRGESIPKTLMAEFKQSKNQMDSRLASIAPAVLAFAAKSSKIYSGKT
ncbi:MAG: hypothetical protein A2484_04875, partial [Nitrospirae bacterium RIFOXYC2_FULL_44_7]